MNIIIYKIVINLNKLVRKKKKLVIFFCQDFLRKIKILFYLLYSSFYVRYSFQAVKNVKFTFSL